MLILHANWYEGGLCLWAESTERFAEHSAEAEFHPFAMESHPLREALVKADLLTPEAVDDVGSLRMRLPSSGSRPQPSDRLASTLGRIEDNAGVALLETKVPCLRLSSAQAAATMLRMEDAAPSADVRFGASLRYWADVARFVLELLADQRFVPAAVQQPEGGMRAYWQPWLHDAGVRTRVSALLSAMPPSARAPLDAHQGQPWPILSDALLTLTDATVRDVLIADEFGDAIDGRDPNADPHVAWLSGLLAQQNKISTSPDLGIDLLRDATIWISRLDETGAGQAMKLCLRLIEPMDAAIAELDDGLVSPTDLTWRLSFHLQAVGDSSMLLDAEALWNQQAIGKGVTTSTGEQPQELLLRELGRASRIYSRIEAALSEPAPVGLDLTTNEAYEFLRQHKPVLEESGIRVLVPQWWDEPASRLGARLQIDSPEETDWRSSAGGAQPNGLNSIVQYRWQIAVGEQSLSMEEFQRLAEQKSPLVRVRGRWIEIRPDDVSRAVGFLRERPGGEMTLLEAIQIAYETDGHPSPGIPVTGLDASGWVSRILGDRPDQRVEMLEQPAAFRGELRPYQKSGLSWLAFLDRFGLGGCLADDMGLGKTIQLIALLLEERRNPDPEKREDGPDGAGIGPTLLIVPTSVVSNWLRELERFAPMLRVYVHHGPERELDSEAFAKRAMQQDVVITTYALITRDREVIAGVDWHRVTLDEAQYIKNPPTKQTAAIRALRTSRRIALTGTPVENRLTELWSIMEFCNPGYLGPFNDFRKRFAVPIERHRDQRRAEALRSVVRPFILRRLKTDPKVISDLPSLVETKEHASLTAEQAALYEAAVNEMLAAVDRAEGIQRRGLVLATLVKLKQICNHPAQIEAASAKPPKTAEHRSRHNGAAETLASDVLPSEVSALSRRSGKAIRLLQLLEEIIASGERALIFTQFRRMGHLLAAMIRNDLDADSLFLHGGTPAAKRQEMIDRFQSESPSAPPIFILSLKAGGLGLNLTAANHVFHFDRWWNPAVENQATDRAFRIGQMRSVHVHKFICTGTLEERIDQMIEQKTELAENIIGSGESWLTELSTGQLQDLLTLRRSALEVEV